MDESTRKMLEEQRERMEKYGYVLHFVFGDPDCPNRTNYHTHGLMSSFNHPDFQICFPLRKEVAEGILAILIDEVKAGKKFEEGIEYPNILAHNYLLSFIRAFDAGREVLRLLIPDQNGLLTEGRYLAQLSMRGFE